MSTQLLGERSLSDLLETEADSLATRTLLQRNREVKLGAARAERIIRLLRRSPTEAEDTDGRLSENVDESGEAC